MVANLSLKRKGSQELCDLIAMDGALPGVGHTMGSETTPGYPVSPTPTCEGVVWIRRLQPLLCRQLDLQGSNRMQWRSKAV